MNRSKPVVSIGMPVYNGERFIREALDSLLAQTFTDFELIISDNASTDATESICRNYAEQDSRIRYIRQRENLGALPNFQFVLNEACGEYFMWAACDDKWDRDWVESLMSALENSGVGAAFGRLMHIDEVSQLLRHPANGRTFKFRGASLRRRIKYFIEFERYGKANPIYSLFRRSVLRDIGLAVYSVDFHIVFDLLLRTEIISVPNTVLYKRVHATSEGNRSGDGLGAALRRWSYLLMPLDIGFTWGYFRQGKVVENCLFLIFLPVKFILGYSFYLKSIVLKARLNLFGF